MLNPMPILDGAAILLLVAFALTFGAQTFDTYVNVPVFFSDVPNSIGTYLNYTTAHRVPAFFARTGIFTIAATAVAIVVNVTVARSPALILSASCAVAYFAMIFVFFAPTNRKLGFLRSGDVQPLSPEQAKRLSRWWQTMNFIRIGLQLVGLLAAALSLTRGSLHA
jgi:hypothetical protein